jgi:hypothetical protein
MRYLFILILIVIVVTGASRLISLSEKLQHESLIFTSSSYVFNLPFLDDFTQQKYLLPDGPTIEDFKNLLTLFLTVSTGFLTTTLNLRWGISLDVRKPSPSSFFASLPLRSPPVLS